MEDITPSTYENDKAVKAHDEYPFAIPATGLAEETHHPGHAEERETEMTAFLRFRHRFREPLAECLGTMVLVMFGDGVVAQVKLSKGAAGDYTVIALSWAAAVMLGYMVSGGISGGHMNPAVTISAAVYRGFPKRKVIPYILGQLLGGFIGAFLVYGIYVQSINHYEGEGIRTVTGATATAGIFCTFPQPYLTTRGQFASELTATALLQLGIFALTDPYNAPAGEIFPLGLFVLIYALGSSFGFQTGYALNMARDFAPRVAAVALGYGGDMFSVYDGYAWVPVVAPIIGGLLGGGLYDLFIYQGKESPVNKRNFGFSRTAKKQAPVQA
ncbi:hypothetical protein BABINDRAFT_160867 [Babjeviella inositovora NRRL Y-12698]|uniref:Aquaporin n=1 Tax=Babjeviella inositovora NRRL Y-12698 TaxID=984486 RepID=A0A1E3QSG6_9ASCO|nr:uncharacterized protein BABINDRAFT_160867 [Babjeviella inositovora NRRL Y-12698]ODQ80610.1 hypothetical protein BABINDRAFT_160867 [Babjeviella inositovora NRRL Y-12698]